MKNFFLIGSVFLGAAVSCLATPLVFTNAIVFASRTEPTVIGISRESGAVLWRKDLPEKGFLETSVAGKALVKAGTNYFVCDPVSGDLRAVFQRDLDFAVIDGSTSGAIAISDAHTHTHSNLSKQIGGKSYGIGVTSGAFCAATGREFSL